MPVPVVQTRKLRPTEATWSRVTYVEPGRGLSSLLAKQQGEGSPLFASAYRMFRSKDCASVEISPRVRLMEAPEECGQSFKLDKAVTVFGRWEDGEGDLG